MNDQNRQAWEQYEPSAGTTTRPLPPLPQQQPHQYGANSRHIRRGSEDVFTHVYDAPIDHNNVPHSIPLSTMEMGNDLAETKSLQSQIGALIPTARTNVLREVLKLLLNSQSLASVTATEPLCNFQHAPINPAVDFAPTMQHASDPLLGMAHVAWHSNQDTPAGVQCEWMPSVQPDPIVVQDHFQDAGFTSRTLNPERDLMNWTPAANNYDHHCSIFNDEEGAGSISHQVAETHSIQPTRDSVRSSHISISSAAAVARHLIHPFPLESGRESFQSSSSYDSTNTGWSLSSKHASKSSMASSIGNRSVRSLGAATMSSRPGPRKGHSRSTSNSSNTLPSNIPCTEPDCSTTFTRPSDRDRHIETQHDDRLYECLLHTCTSQCPEQCQDPHHSCAFRRGRRDKITAHLKEVHGENVTGKKLPESWLWLYIWQKSGWSCKSCGVVLGNWIENADAFEGHSEVCTGGLPNLVKRMSVEEST
ncbi:uncharacterized protein PAC_10616 [Phialocephala subalpina]|uniref:C2H2-type domain-containing protein n=1 Tax=Phialocephala subalpina TaxID=576137 RepID=A0A1L7X6S1_9HELO|nr:uncharacterized protein PAC_10616 [Phialocephala subalpina]